MHIAILTNIISPHQIPLAEELRKLIHNSVNYIHTEVMHRERSKIGWDSHAQDDSWCRHAKEDDSVLSDCDVLISGLRTVSLFNQRVKQQKLTFYMSERWFKPSWGILRLLSLRYFKMALQMVKLLDNKNFYYLPIGVHAARDMIRLYELLHGDLRCLFRAPEIAFESAPGGAIIPLKQAIYADILSPQEIRFAKRYGFVQIPQKHWGKISPDGIYTKLKMWGYFVESSKESCCKSEKTPRKVLWVGRLLALKRVDTLFKAVKTCLEKKFPIRLTVVGNGPEKEKLLKMAENIPEITFLSSVPIAEVRQLMRKHDIYCLPSNGYEGWGAVVSEALEENMTVYASVESGAGATMLPAENLFDANDHKRLAELLIQPCNPRHIGVWSAENAAKSFLNFIKSHK